MSAVRLSFGQENFHIFNKDRSENTFYMSAIYPIALQIYKMFSKQTTPKQDIANKKIRGLYSPLKKIILSDEKYISRLKLHHILHTLLLLTLCVTLCLLCSLLVKVLRLRLNIGADNKLILVVRLVHIFHCLRINSTC